MNTMTHSSQPFCSITEAAAHLGVSRVTVWRWIRDGYLPATRSGPRTIRIKVADLERSLSPRESGGAPSGSPLADTSSEAPLTPTQLPAADHAVQFYEDDGFLINTVAEFIGDGLRMGEPGIVVATPAHREGIEARLRAARFDFSVAVSSGLYRALDAAETLRRFMIDETPDADRFVAVIDDVVSRATRGSRRIRIFGEMVALLTAEGNIGAAVQLEALWSDLQRSRNFSLLCAYPIGQLGGEMQANALGDICSLQTRVAPAESYLLLPTEHGKLQAVIALQQQNHWLRRQVAERQ